MGLFARQGGAVVVLLLLTMICCHTGTPRESAFGDLTGTWVLAGNGIEIYNCRGDVCERQCVRGSDKRCASK